MANYTDILYNSSESNATTSPAIQPVTYPILNTFLSIAAIFIIITNGLVIYLFITKSFLKEVTNYFLVSLAVSDGLTGLLIIPLFLSCAYIPRIELCFYFDLSHRLTAFATVYHLLLITCDRYIAICRPFKHSLIFTSHVSIILLSLVWFFSLLLPLIQFAWCDLENLGEPTTNIRQHDLRYSIACLIIGFLLPVLFMVFAYSKMLNIVLRHAREVDATIQERVVISKEKRAMIIFSTMLIIYITCWFSFFFLSLNEDLDEHIEIPVESDFRKAVRETFALCHKCKRTTQTGLPLQNRLLPANGEEESVRITTSPSNWNN